MLDKKTFFRKKRKVILFLCACLLYFGIDISATAFIVYGKQIVIDEKSPAGYKTLSVASILWLTYWISKLINDQTLFIETGVSQNSDIAVILITFMYLVMNVWGYIRWSRLEKVTQGKTVLGDKKSIISALITATFALLIAIRYGLDWSASFLNFLGSLVLIKVVIWWTYGVFLVSSIIWILHWAIRPEPEWAALVMTCIFLVQNIFGLGKWKKEYNEERLKHL